MRRDSEPLAALAGSATPLPCLITARLSAFVVRAARPAVPHYGRYKGRTFRMGFNITLLRGRVFEGEEAVTVSG